MLLYYYLHKLKFFTDVHFATFETCIDSLRYVMMYLSPIRFCHQVFIRTTQLTCASFSAHPAKFSFFIPPPAHHFDLRQHPTNIQYLSPGLAILSGPSPLFNFQLFDVLLPDTNSPFLHVPKFLYLQIPVLFSSLWTNLPAHLGIIFHVLFLKDWQAVPSFLCLHSMDSFCFPLMMLTDLAPFAGQAVLRADFYFCHCHDLLCVSFRKLLLLLFCLPLRW